MIASYDAGVGGVDNALRNGRSTRERDLRSELRADDPPQHEVPVEHQPGHAGKKK